MYCIKCGSSLSPNDAFCRKCGAEQHQTIQNNGPLDFSKSGVSSTNDVRIHLEQEIASLERKSARNTKMIAGGIIALLAALVFAFLKIPINSGYTSITYQFTNYSWVCGILGVISLVFGVVNYQKSHSDLVRLRKKLKNMSVDTINVEG